MSVAAKRVVALLAAVGLVVGAVFVRRAMDDTANDGSGSTTATTGTGGSTDDRPTLLCSTELAAACRTLSGVKLTIEDPGVSAKKIGLHDGGLGYDAWLVAKPWADIVDLRRARNTYSPLPSRTPVLAHGAALAVVDTARNTAVSGVGGQPACDPAGRIVDCALAHPGEQWGAVGGQAAWGTIKVGLPDPTRTTVGMSVLAQTAVDWVHRPGTDPAAVTALADLVDDPDFADHLHALKAAVPSDAATAADPVRQLLTVPQSYSVAFGADQATRRQVSGSATPSRWTMASFGPSIDIVAVGTLPVARSRVVSALQAAGWKAPPAAGRSDGLPPVNSSPDPAVIEGLVDLWSSS